ncbi:S-adenosyl-L-methionine-dependent methyltransferase, partial [Mucor lusitanicus]
QLENGITVLDAGCGPGCWSIDMAVKYKNSQFHGVDILGTQFPQEKDMPTNTRFVVGNLADNIPYPDNTFDFIYQRLLYFAFTKEQWIQNLKELHRALKPGGCVELIEVR